MHEMSHFNIVDLPILIVWIWQESMDLPDNFPYYIWFVYNYIAWKIK